MAWERAEHDARGGKEGWFRINIEGPDMTVVMQKRR